MAGLPHYSIVPCCSNKGQQETFFLIPLGVIKDIENGVHEYTGSEVTLNGVTFTPGYCYNIIFQGSAFEFYPSSPVSDTFTKLENNNCDNLECAPCVPCFELTSCNGTSQNIIISNSQELYNHYVNNNIVTLLGYEGCWEINTHEDCECAVSVTVLTSHPSCQECLPIVNYKFTSCDNQSIIRYSTDDYSAYVGKTVELECGGCWFVSEIDFVPPSTQTIDILYTFDSCSACAKTYYKLTNCTDDTQVIYTDSVLNLQLPQISTFNANPDPNPVPTNCNCIKVTYELQQTNCDCISVTYQLIGEEPVTVEVESSGTNEGKPTYNLSVIATDLILIWYSAYGPYTNVWAVETPSTTESVFEAETVCPFGTFTIPEGSIFESFSVEPCEPNEPVTVEVQEEDGSFTFDGYELSCNDGVWSVSGEEESCNCVQLTFTTSEQITIVTLNAEGVDETGRSYYSATLDEVIVQISWFETRWRLIVIFGDSESQILGELFEDGLCPFGNWSNLSEGVDGFDSIISEACGSPSGGCIEGDCIKVSFILDGIQYEYEVPKVGVFNGKNVYSVFESETFNFEIYWSNNNGIFGIDATISEDVWFKYTNSTDSDYPIFDMWTYSEGIVLTNLTTTLCDCPPTTYATLTASCDCAVGQYTIPENSVFTSFVVELCSVPSNTVISIQECPGCFIVEPTRTPVNPVKVTLVEVFTDCLDCLPAPPQPVVISQPKRKIKPGYSVPTCDIHTYEKITCKASEILYKQVLQLRYGISNCCPEEDEKWLIKKELIDLVSLIDPNYICKPNTSCCNQPINDCGCNTLKTCNSQ